MMQSRRQANPFVQLLGLILGFVFFVAAVVLGGIVIAAIIGTLLIAVTIVYVRVWWLTRKARQQSPGETFVEVEYRVIDEADSNDDRL